MKELKIQKHTWHALYVSYIPGTSAEREVTGYGVLTADTSLAELSLSVFFTVQFSRNTCNGMYAHASCAECAVCRRLEADTNHMTHGSTHYRSHIPDQYLFPYL